MSAPKMYPSKAPPPIKPLSGMGTVSIPLPKQFTTAVVPDWNHWLAMGKVKNVRVWQATLLTDGIDPFDLKYDSLDWQRMPTERGVKIRKRYAVLCGHFGHSHAPVTLEQIAIIGLSNKWDMPSELLGLAKKAKSQDEAPAAQSKADASQQSARPLRQQLSQEQEILRVIGELKYTANALPKREKAGAAWVKAEVRKKLNYSTSVFNKAWERLRTQGDIKETP